jgi:NDP-sugar pyrophosphorylase family protein
MSHIDTNPRAFIFGAGLGTRLRPLTDNLPKPLVPIRGNPLVYFALNHLKSVGVKNIIINTHHAFERWQQTFPDSGFDGMSIEFRYEKVLLETGGGLKNVEDYLKNHGDFWIYNGDILCSLPLQKAWSHHHQQQNLVTLVLRSKGGPLHVGLDETDQIIDIGNKLGRNPKQNYLFTGIHVVNPDIFHYLPPLQVISIIPIYLDLIQKGHRIGGVVIDEGDWSDVGTLEEYERVNRAAGPS